MCPESYTPPTLKFYVFECSLSVLNVGDIQSREQVNAIGCFKNRELMLTPVNFYIANERRHYPAT